MNNCISVNIGIQRFDRIREQKSFYIDKTAFIKEWWETGSDVTLITRPRRFGKTLNMSMVECFFSNKYAGRGDLFEGLSIWEEKSPDGAYKYRQLQGMFPVIFLSFANIKAAEYKKMEYKITEVIASLYAQNSYLLEGNLLSENEKKYYKSIEPGIGDEVAEGAVHFMANFMQRYYGKDVIIILDEYDTPMQEAWMAGYWDKAVAFFSGFFNSTFKTNPYLYRGLITGITRIAKESIFSGMNNPDVIMTTSDEYACAFGFTEEEVFAALDAAGYGSEKQEVKRWYDGFTFGSYTDIYNPWSIASFIKKNGKYDSYWANTSSNGLVNSLLQGGNADIKQVMEELLCGKSIEAEIDEQIVFNQLDGNANAVWSLLLATGYLKVLKLKRVGEFKKKVYTLALTNMEVRSMFTDMVKGWFGGSTETAYNNFIKALLINDVDAMNEFMNKIALHCFSNFDLAKSAADDDAPERFYHGFVLGLMVELADRFQITSNRESGFGRYDVMLTPINRSKDCAYIIEFKVHKPLKEKSLEETVANALAQIDEKQYETELIAKGFTPEQVRKYGFAFRGKECLIGINI
ncbi:MAG: ATP-binding protein [Lachnospiraceae bacterium]|nr:ATP-binding protein [Lachnospiraceae bacterium]